MKNGLVLLTNPSYPPSKARELADEGFHVAVCDHPDDISIALRSYFKRLIYTPGTGYKTKPRPAPQKTTRCVCGKKMVYCDTILSGDVYKCTGRLPDGEWCGKAVVL